MFDCIEENHELSRSMKYSIINLIYKEKGEKNDLKKIRPISLLNVDYTILARIMSNRLKMFYHILYQIVKAVVS